MKTLFNIIKSWINDSNHYKHILLSIIVAICACVLHSFVLKDTTIISSIITTLCVGIAIEIYQYILTKNFTPASVKNSIGDLFSDIIGCGIGILLYYISITNVPISSFILYGSGILLMFSWFIIRKIEKLSKYKTYILFLGTLVGIFGVYTFIFA